ncbi:hypothetical protein MPOCJGCO_0697 [Methylobacterium trifolii]|uniref:Uncharacterized protein n=1 Tax=Methylobacterium trifolii TaxID=1003092 RepID=A0ABQ4TTR9_9HYPH|nr:hypothetical protein MPOCJGCO_0697 [Methylobacterium trifolii]
MLARLLSRRGAFMLIYAALHLAALSVFLEYALRAPLFED